jgi:hypothetical protein
MLMFVAMLMLVFMFMFMSAAIAVGMLLVRRTRVDVELHALDVLPLCAVVVHVKVSEVQLAQFPFERARPDAEVNERADHHVAADSRNAVQVESFHCKLSGGRRRRIAQATLRGGDRVRLKAEGLGVL